MKRSIIEKVLVIVLITAMMAGIFYKRMSLVGALATIVGMVAFLIIMDKIAESEDNKLNRKRS